MTTLRVWAPNATAAEVVTSAGRVPMRSEDRGWFSVEAPPEAADGYQFSLDGGPPRPDPRSPWQPDGIDRVSRPLDDGAFTWTDATWHGVHLPSSTVYELHVGTFSEAGTFDGVIDHLDHLVELGVDIVELLPVAEFPGRRGWGYDGVQPYAPHHAYGGPAGLARLVDACHNRGLGVVLDVVYNHLGPSGNHLPAFGPYFTDTYRTPWGDAVNVDGAGSDEVRRYLIDNACHWLERYHLDGLRLDAVHAIFDMSALHVLEELAAEVDALSARVGRPLWLIAESDRNDPRVVLPREAGGYGLHAQWSDDLHHAVHTLLTGEQEGYYADYGTVAHLARALQDGWIYGRTWSPARQRHHGKPAAGLPGWRFVVSTQNHDQVGNRALGERLVHLTDVPRAKLAAGLVLLSPFVPMLFQGEEWGASTPFLYFTDHPDPELGEAVRRGRREEFKDFVQPDDVPDPQDEATFRRSCLRWEERLGGEHAELLAWYRRLLALRRHAGLAAGPAGAHRVAFDEAERWLVLERGRHRVVANLGPTPRRVPVGGAGEVVLASGPVELDGGDVLCPPWGLAVLVGP